VTVAFELRPTCWDCDRTLDVLTVGPEHFCESTTTARCVSCGVTYALNVRMAPFGRRKDDRR
jgi:hypothetical protein